jgi:hypothetical protein
MTIYSSFATKHDLIDALAAHLLGAHDTLPNEELPMEQRIAEWMWRFRATARDVRLFELFSARAPLNALVEAGASWTAQLQQCGWPTKQAATFAHHLMSTVTGFCLTWSNADRVPVPTAAASEVHADLRPAAATFLKQLPRNTDDVLFRLLVDAVIAGYSDAARDHNDVRSDQISGKSTTSSIARK